MHPAVHPFAHFSMHALWNTFDNGLHACCFLTWTWVFWLGRGSRRWNHDWPSVTDPCLDAVLRDSPQHIHLMTALWSVALAAQGRCWKIAHTRLSTESLCGSMACFLAQTPAQLACPSGCLHMSWSCSFSQIPPDTELQPISKAVPVLA